MLEDLEDISDDAGVDFDPYDLGDEDLEKGPSPEATGCCERWVPLS